MKRSNILLYTICLLVLIAIKVHADTLQFFISIARNGIREPDVNLQTGLRTNQTLTPAGMRQQYLLGTYYAQRYRSDYPNYLDTTYSPYRLHVRSSNKDRMLNSAQSMLLALFPFGTGPNVTGSDPSVLNPPLTLTVDTSNLGTAAAWNNYQPIAIHTTSENVDFLLRAYYLEACPTLNQTRSARLNDFTYTNISAMVAPTAQQIRNTINISSNYKLNTLEDMFYFYDTIVSNHQNGIDSGISPDSDLFQTIAFLAQFYDLYIYNGNNQLIQTGMSPLITEILSNLDADIAGKNNLQGVIYIAHDTTITGMIAALGLSSYQCVMNYYFSNTPNDMNCIGLPQYSSHIELELLTDNFNNYYMKIFYDGVELLPCNGQRCSYSSFKNLIFPFTVNSITYRALCGNIMLQDSPYKQYDYSNVTQTTTTTSSSGGGSFGLIILNILLGLGIYAVKKYGRDFVKSRFGSRPNQVNPEPLGQELRNLSPA